MYTVNITDDNLLYELRNDSLKITSPFYIVNLQSDGNVITDKISKVTIIRLNTYSEYNNYTVPKITTSTDDNNSYYNIDYVYRISGTEVLSILDSEIKILKNDIYNFIDFDHHFYSLIKYNVNNSSTEVGVFDLDNKISYKIMGSSEEISDYTGLYGELHSEDVYTLFSQPNTSVNFTINSNVDNNPKLNLSIHTLSTSPIFNNFTYGDIYQSFFIIKNLDYNTGYIDNQTLFAMDIRKIEAINSLLPDVFRVSNFSQTISNLSIESIDGKDYLKFYFNTMLIPNISDFGRSIFVSAEIFIDFSLSYNSISINKINFAIIPTEYVCPIIQIWDRIKPTDNSNYTLDNAINETYVYPVTFRSPTDEYDRIFIISTMYNYISIIDGYFIDLDNSIRLSIPEHLQYYDGESLSKQSVVGILFKDQIPDNLIIPVDIDIFNSKLDKFITYNDTFPGVKIQNIVSLNDVPYDVGRNEVPFFMNYTLDRDSVNVTNISNKDISVKTIM